MRVEVFGAAKPQNEQGQQRYGPNPGRRLIGQREMLEEFAAHGAVRIDSLDSECLSPSVTEPSSCNAPLETHRTEQAKS